MPTLTTEIQEDRVITEARRKLSEAEIRLGVCKKRLEETEGASLRTDLSARRSFVEDALLRQKELELIQSRVSELKRYLQECIDDLPRRMEAQSRADELKSEAAKMAEKITAKQEELVRLQEKHSTLLKSAGEFEALTGGTMSQILQAEADAKKRRENLRAERIQQLEANLRGAEMALANDIKNQCRPEHIQEVQTRRDKRKAELETFLQEV
jgi:hypothetical protein